MAKKVLIEKKKKRKKQKPNIEKIHYVVRHNS